MLTRVILINLPMREAKSVPPAIREGKLYHTDADPTEVMPIVEADTELAFISLLPTRTMLMPGFGCWVLPGLPL